MLDSVAELLGENGPFATNLKNYSIRPQQQAMAQAIADTFGSNQDLVVEAGTGTGKTFAYLVPAILSGKKVIISTGTKNLQDQLYHRDIPVVRKALNVSVSCALLKGRGNYLCHHHLDQAQEEAPQNNPELVPQLQKIRDWTRQTRSGDIADFAMIPETDPIWYSLTSSSDNCVGAECACYQSCFVMAARREAQAADVVIINHHLLMSDLSLQEEGFGELLPAADAYIIDEAHQLPEIASQFFGAGVSTQQFIELAQDSQRAYLEAVNEERKIDEHVKNLTNASRDLKISFGRDMRRSPWSEISKETSVVKNIEKLKKILEQLEGYLQPLVERSGELEACHDRCVVLGQRFEMVTEQVTNDYIHWFEVHRRSVTIHVTPMEIASTFSEHKERKGGVWIFTSATLTVANQFNHFVQRIGLNGASTRKWDSPFDYKNQALMFLPPDMPEPNTFNYTQSVINISKQVLDASKGRAFILFTSYRALNAAEEELRDTIEYPLFVQGEAPRDRLLEKFRQTENAVLLGTSSFWEGVDVRGEALSCVIIDKLPFAAPNDPVLQARLDALKEKGLNPFMHYQLPSAVITLKQGVGRLIRDQRDRGVLVLCDPRLKSKSYGRTFLNSLPTMPVTNTINDVVAFFDNNESLAEVNV